MNFSDKDELERERYIVTHFDEALEDGWIEVYFQPVVRTMTANLCGMEGLARWNDPEWGMIGPYLFIPVLEDHDLIARLDLYMLEQICALYRKRTDAGEGFVPVSVNFSRRDFNIMDMVPTIDEVVTRYRMPREFLHIEITESVFAQSAKIREYMDQFKALGYAVWMDDFGSGYSSLNILKNLDFDTIKIDMEFFRNFTDKSKIIITGLVAMAKDLGTATVAEGVETEDQYLFLKEVGCNKIQGYYFGKPEPFDDMLSHFMAQGYGVEQFADASFMDVTGMVSPVSPFPFGKQDQQTNDQALAIAIFDGEHYRFVYRNEPFKLYLKSLGVEIDVDGLEGPAYPDNPIETGLMRMLESAYEMGEFRTNFALNLNYYGGRLKVIDRKDKKASLLMRFTDLSDGTVVAGQQKLDAYLRYIYNIFGGLYILDLKTDQLETIYQDMPMTSKKREPYTIAAMETADKGVYAEDRERYLAFFSKEHLEEVSKSYGADGAFIRLKTTNGQYEWKYYIILSIPDRRLMIVYRSTDRNVPEQWLLGMQQEEREANPDLDRLRDADMWRAYVNFTDQKIFWKDRDLRFQGSNVNFLKYYGFESQQAILGKTDIDMGWHVNPAIYFRDEEDVINKGKVVRNVPGTCIIRGRNHNITCSKYPVYKDGQIVGLVGMFKDMDAGEEEDLPEFLKRVDPMTGLLSLPGMTGAFAYYLDEYNVAHRDFAGILISIENFSDLTAAYEEKVVTAILKEVGAMLLKEYGAYSVIGRESLGNFLILSQLPQGTTVADVAEHIQSMFANDITVDGQSVSVYVSVRTYCSKCIETPEELAEMFTRGLSGKGIGESEALSKKEN